MTTLNQRLEAQAANTQRLNAQQARVQALASSVFTAAPVSPFTGFRAEPSEQQLALQARNAPAQRPDQAVSTASIDGSIGRLNGLQTELRATERMLGFDRDRVADIKDILTRLQTDIEESRTSSEDFEPPALPVARPQKLSIERTEYVSNDALAQGNVSLSSDTRIGDLNEGKGLSLHVSANGKGQVISADADETLGDFIGRVDAEIGVTARLDELGRVTISAHSGASLGLREVEAGSLTALALNSHTDFTAASADNPAAFIDTYGTRTKKTTVDKVTVVKLPDNAQERINDRNDAIRRNQEKLETKLENFWNNARDNIDAELERSFDRGSSLLGGLSMSLPTADGAGGGRRITVGNMSADGLGLTDLGDLLKEGRYDEVNDLIGGAIARLNGADGSLSFAISVAGNEQETARRSIGRLADERDAILDAFTAEEVARNTGLSLSAIQLATAVNRSEDLRNL